MSFLCLSFLLFVVIVKMVLSDELLVLNGRESGFAVTEKPLLKITGPGTSPHRSGANNASRVGTKAPQWLHFYPPPLFSACPAWHRSC